ncbi:MAG: hydrogenase maturation protease [Solirubrobacteraceae bacterium]|jgi:hydrogenase maturation protease|nr:hydrogenase maturation protease [Solirubrobacteraceae bacterium]
MSDRPGYWEELERPGPDTVLVGGESLRVGSRVRLHPGSRTDVWDAALEGRAAVIEGVEQDMEGRVQFTVIVDDDPGRDLGERKQPGHRFFFGPEEVEPLGPGEDAPEPTGPRVLVAGIGNVFLGDDGWGVALADRLSRRALPAGVDVVDYGIRGMDLAYSMLDGGYDSVLMLDAVPRGGAPGTVYVIEPEVDPGDVAIDTHGMDPVKVLTMVQGLGGSPPRTLVVGVEPANRLDADVEEFLVELSEPVRAALDEAERVVTTLLEEMT